MPHRPLATPALALFTGWLLAAGAPAADDGIGHPTFLSPHASPIVAGNGQVFVVNTPADTLDIIDAAAGIVTHRIPVGIDPVGLAMRPDGLEVWVSNHVSDSVSIIDTDAASPWYLQVVATVQSFNPLSGATRFDEPVGIAFASNDKAYVALSSQNQVAVIGVATRQVSKTIAITAQDPRALRVRDERLYVIPFESNNRTQISGCINTLGTDLCTFDANQHVVVNNNVLSTNAVVDIVKNPAVPDRDLYVFDTDNEQLVDITETVGTLLYGLAVDSRHRVFVAQADARNEINGLAGSRAHGLAQMENRAFLNQVTQLRCGGDSCGKPRFFQLEPLPPVNPDPEAALATPFAIEVSADDATLFATAAGSRQFFTLDAESGALLGRVEVGTAPRGIALEVDGGAQATRAWVLNAVDNSVSLVDVSDPTRLVVLDTIALEDPTHPEVKAGRIAFNDAGASTSATFSCESCHPDGGTDQLVWVLDTPICDVPGCNQIPPRITMPIRGLRDTAPYHWDGIPGDPYGGRNTANINGFVAPTCEVEQPESCTRDLVDGGLASTMCAMGACPSNDSGQPGALTEAQRAAMARFLLAIPYPPAQRRSFDNVLSDRARSGFRLFHMDGDLQGDPQPNVCGDCHRMPFWVSTNTPGTGMEAPTWRGAYDRWLVLPQGRINLIDFGFFQALARQGIPERGLWRATWGSRTRFDPVWDMVLEGSTGFPGAFARQVTLNRDSSEEDLTGTLLEALERAAAGGAVVLRGEGRLLEGAAEATREVELQFDRRVDGGAYIERSDAQRRHSRADLLALAGEGRFIGTFTGRLGPAVDLDHPQPALWSVGPIQSQRGRQVFPTVSGDNSRITLSGRHIRKGAKVWMDGRRVAGSVTCQSGELPDCDNETVHVHLPAAARPAGMHFLQVQNPGGLVSNDYIVHSTGPGADNCPDIPNPAQADSDGDGVGDRCDVDAFTYAVGPAVSGAWYDPAHDGEGWFVQVLDDERALVYWFTYTPPGEGREGAQAWIGGVGRVQGSAIEVAAAESFITHGPSFGSGFDPQHVVRSSWGRYVLNFSGCTRGLMHYVSSDPDYGQGSLELRRLSHIDGLDCNGPSEPAPGPAPGQDFVVSGATSGAWYDPSHDGEGWILEVLEGGRALLAWFSYTPDGRQAWFLNTGTVQGDRISFELAAPTGTDFGLTFDPAAVRLPKWGSVTMTFKGCDSGSLTYDSPLAGYGSGQLELVRLTRLAGLDCR